MDHVEIVRQYQTQDIDTQGKAQHIVVIDFNVGTDGPFSVRIPLSQFTADVARAAVQQLAYEVQGSRNM